jgi:hypothetical protein
VKIERAGILDRLLSQTMTEWVWAASMADHADTNSPHGNPCRERHTRGATAMHDIRQRISSGYLALDRQKQILLLAKLANRLTIVARDTYDLQGGVADAVRLKAVNEAQHRILSQLVRLLTDDARRYPDDVFANILVDQFNNLSLDPDDLVKFAG